MTSRAHKTPEARDHDRERLALRREDNGLRQMWQDPLIEKALTLSLITLLIGHVRMLGDNGVVEGKAAEQVIEALKAMASDLKAGSNVLLNEDQDIISGIERKLREAIGDLSEAINVGNSRSDQTAAAIRLWLRDMVKQAGERLIALRNSVVSLAERDAEIVMPGYAHMQHTSAMFLSQWWLANDARFRRDYGRLLDLYRRLNFLPFAAGARAQADARVDRSKVAYYLGFDGVNENSVDTISDRDYVIEFASFAALLAVHISQLSSDLILWSTSEFGFVRLPRSLDFRGEIIAQKRQREMLEILRGKCAVISGRLSEFLISLKGLSLSDSQELHECLPGLFSIVEQLNFTLDLTLAFLPGCEFDDKRMREAANPDLASSRHAIEFLVERDVPRERATKIVDALVAYCKDRRKQLSDLTVNEWTQFSPAFDENIYKSLLVDELEIVGAVNGTNAYQGLLVRIAQARQTLESDETLLPGQRNIN
ncbi:MAG TPA: argininosuccinate lyase [Candidatus Obscuribacterales bacterium]